MNIQEELQVMPPPVQEKPISRSLWKHVLWVGVMFYLTGLIILLFTGNPNLFPTVVMLGNFLVPIVYVTFFFERRHLSRLTVPTTASAFIYGGILGVFAASLLEPIFIRQLDVVGFLNIGLIEEFAKILGVWAIARHRRHDAEMDGLILGAAVGMGFASLESNGYAFVAFLQSGGSLSATVWVTLLRGLLSPVGHGTCSNGVRRRSSRRVHWVLHAIFHSGGRLPDKRGREAVEQLACFRCHYIRTDRSVRRVCRVFRGFVF
jgi:hypothetical protein